MIPEYKHDKDKPIDFETALEGMPEIAQQIAQQSTWAQYEQAPDLSDIPFITGRISTIGGVGACLFWHTVWSYAALRQPEMVWIKPFSLR